MGIVRQLGWVTPFEPAFRDRAVARDPPFLGGYVTAGDRRQCLGDSRPGHVSRFPTKMSPGSEPLR